MKTDVSLPQFEYSTPQQWTALDDQLIARLQSDPGLQDAALAAPTPLIEDYVNLGFEIEGVPPLSAGSSRTANFASVSPSYYRVMGIALLRGREFNREDIYASPRVTLISESFAQMYFPNQDPIGKRIVFAFPPAQGVPREIVGVVADIRDVSLNRAPGPIMYIPYAQGPFWGADILVKTSLSPSSVAAAIRHDVAEIDKDLPVSDVVPLADGLRASVAEPRFRTMLLGLFSVLTLVLAAAGIFGVISYSVSYRTHEIGIRMALGASRGNVLWLILSQSARLLLIGLAVGVSAALVFARLLSNLLFGVGPADPLTFAAVAFLLAIVAFAASYIPTRRAMRVDPMVALRYE